MSVNQSLKISPSGSAARRSELVELKGTHLSLALSTWDKEQRNSALTRLRHPLPQVEGEAEREKAEHRVLI